MILSSEYIFSIDPSARYAEISVQNTSKSDAEKTRQNEFLMEQIVASSDNVSVQNHIQEKEQYDSTVQNGQMLIAGCLLIFLLILMGAVSLSASVKLHFSFRSYLFMKWRKWIAAFAAAALLAASVPAVFAEPATAAATVTGNLVRITTASDFSSLQLTNLTVDETVGDGAVRLTDSNKEGELITGVYSCAEFTRMVASWNADTPDGSTVEVTARGHLTGTDTWTKWLSWGVWGTEVARSCGDSETARDANAYVDTDVFSLRKDTQTVDQFQLRVVLRSKASGASPVLRQLCATLQNNLEGKEIKPVYAEETVSLPDKVLLSTPAYSQMVRDPDISTSICSPTTITALLNDRGEDLLPEQTALSTYDFNYKGFGNWAFALATAGSFGYDSYVQFGNLDIIRQELAKGYSVGIDVHYMIRAISPYGNRTRFFIASIL